MSNIISGGRSVDLNVQAGQSLKVTTISGTYTATVLAGAGAGTALATDSADGATYGPYAAAVTIRIKSSATGFVDYDVGVSPSLGYRSPAYFGHNTAGDIASLVDGDGNQVASFALTTTTTTGATTLTTAALQSVTLGGTHQLTMPASPGAVAGSFVLLLTCAGFTPTWSGVTWLTSSGVAPTLNTVAGKRNAITFIWDNSLPGWLGFLSGVQA